MTKLLKRYKKYVYIIGLIIVLGFVGVIFQTDKEARGATNYYVRDLETYSSCNDSNPGTSAVLAFCTIQAALDNPALVNGDIIYVGSGIYVDENPGTTIGIEMPNDKKVNLIADVGGSQTGNKGPVIIDATGQDYGIYYDSTVSGQNDMSINGFEIKNADKAGIYCSDIFSYGFIQNNIIHDNGEYGLDIYHTYLVDAGYSAIRNNLIFNNGTAGIRVRDKIEGGGLTGDISNNTFFKNGLYGIVVTNYMETIKINNNIFYGHTIAGVSTGGDNSAGLATSLSNNTFWRNTARCTAVGDPGNELITSCGNSSLGNYDRDPKLTGNFFLAATSSAINTGSTPASSVGLTLKSARSDCSNDLSTVDRGFHYTLALCNYFARGSGGYLPVFNDDEEALGSGGGLPPIGGPYPLVIPATITKKYYVINPDSDLPCNDSNNGLSVANAFCSIERAIRVINSASYHSAIIIGPGVYYEGTNHLCANGIYTDACDSTSSSSPNPSRCWETGGAQDGTCLTTGFMTYIIGDSYGYYTGDTPGPVVIDGDGLYNAALITYSHGGGWANTHVYNLEIRNMNQFGLVYGDGITNGSTIANNYIHDVGKYAIYTKQSIGPSLISNNLLTDNLGGIRSKGAFSGTIQNNTIIGRSKSSGAGFVCYDFGPTTECTVAPGMIIRNNIFSYNQRPISAEGPASNADAYGNIFWDNAGNVCDPVGMCAGDPTNRTTDPKIIAEGSFNVDREIDTICGQKLPVEKMSGDSQMFLDPLSPAIDTGVSTIETLGLAGLSVTPDCLYDVGKPDIGYHHYRCPASLLVPDVSGTYEDPIKIYIRTAADNGGSPGTWTEWMGPDGVDGDTNDFYEASGQPLLVRNPQQWFQYKIEMASNGSYTPVIKEFKLDYLP